MKTRIVVCMCAAIALLSGCATMDGYGPNASILGGAGAVLGSAITQSNPAVGAVLGGVGGYYIGSGIDERRAAEGSTHCRSGAHWERRGDQLVKVQESQDCSATTTRRGYRNYPQ